MEVWRRVRELEVLDAAAVLRWGRSAARALSSHRAAIDEMNVFPVADGDTGSNLALTMTAAADALEAAPGASAGDALAVLARAAVLAARGNSGVIVSQLLRGLADAADGDGSGYGAEQLRQGLAIGVRYAYAAVAEPVEGTVLSVASAAAAELPPPPAPLGEISRAAVRAAESALRRTPQQLPALARAGVVDAGGQGLLLVLDALAATVTGVPGTTRPDVDGANGATAGDGLHGDGGPATRGGRRRGMREAGSAAFEYEVQYLLEAPARATGGLREALTALGDSVVVAGTGDGTWNVHAHVNDVGAAIESGVAAGAVRQISVVRFDDAATAEARPTAVIAIGAGAQLAHLFTREGVSVLDAADGTVTEAEVLAAARATGVDQVVLLPNSVATAGVAESAAAVARVEGIRVAVVPTRSPVQGLAAVAVHDAARGFDDDVVAMAEAAAATRHAEVVVAGEQSLTSVGICQAGDVLGLIDGEVVEIGSKLLPVAYSLVARLLGVGAELMTVLIGPQAPAGAGDLIAGRVRELAPLTDVTVYLGGPDGCPLVIGVE